MIEIEMTSSSTLRDMHHLLGKLKVNAVEITLEPRHCHAVNQERYDVSPQPPKTLWVATRVLHKSNIVPLF
jgi:hypothetical protein